jgi:pimeloyl-ACP methyl ester carboxylesterase
MTHETRLRRMLVALALIGAWYPSHPSAFLSGGGCPYTTTDYVTPDGAGYELHQYPGEEFYYHDSSRRADPSFRADPLVVLVAGVPEPHYFDALRALLLGANYRVLVLDLPGKEHTRLSGRPTAEFVVDRFHRLWTRDFHDETDFLIVGTSVSGPVTALMAARWKDQKPKLALVSALGMPREWPYVIRLGRIPLLSDLLAVFLLPGQVEDRWRNGELLCPQNFPNLFKRQQTEFRGPWARINHLELPKALALSDQTGVYQQLAKSEVPVMLAYGDHDPFSDQRPLLKNILPHAQITTITDSAHIAFVEQPDQTFNILDHFMRPR